MSLLAQQELLEVPPTRRLIVPRGQEAHLGVDLSVRAVSIASVTGSPEDGLERCVETIPLDTYEGGMRLAYAFATIRDVLRALILAGRLPLPGFIFVEQPSGKFDNPALSYMCGVVQGAVYAGASLAGARAPTVETVPSSSWKLRGCGRGNLPKPTKKKLGRSPVFTDYGVAVWARQNGYDGLSFDEADAWGIAEAARLTVLLDPR